jgi:Mini-chromosome maintenance replisome factor
MTSSLCHYILLDSFFSAFFLLFYFLTLLMNTFLLTYFHPFSHSILDDHAPRRLPLSPLQLARGTVLIIDESGLTEGTLTEIGNRSVAALKSIALHQKLPISYPYYELLVPTDLPLIVVTSSPKGNALCGGPNVLLVVLCPVSGSGQKGDADASSVSRGSSSDPSHSSTVIDAMDEDGNEAADGHVQKQEEDEDEEYEEWITKARMWWATVRMLDVTISDAVAAQCVESFAQTRQTDLRLEQNAFHQWLTISRLIAISEGAKEITAEHWVSMRALEAVRVDRAHTAWSSQE